MPAEHLQALNQKKYEKDDTKFNEERIVKKQTVHKVPLSLPRPVPSAERHFL